MTTLPVELLVELFSYCDGVLRWKKDVANNVKAGDIAGRARTASVQRYEQICYKGKNYSLHRVIFAMHHGYWPKYVDHIDGDTSNNRIENLRSATASQNCFNGKMRVTNTSGVKGVSKRKNGSWRVYIKRGVGKYPYEKQFAKFEDACAHAIAIRPVLHGEFANLG